MATISTGRDGHRVNCCIDTVESPDKTWWYLRNLDFNANRTRVSIDNYPSESKARRAYNDGDVKWDAWT